MPEKCVIFRASACRKRGAQMLDSEQAKLYELIWIRTIASQMESAELERTTGIRGALASAGR